MNTYEEELRTKWNGINCHDGGSIQLAVEHPLDWFVRYATADHKSIVIVSETPADKININKSIASACNKRKDGKICGFIHIDESGCKRMFSSPCRVTS